MKVLFADRNVIFSASVAELLERKGVSEVTMVGTNTAALARLAEKEFDLVIVNQGTLQPTGLDVLQSVADRPGKKLLISSYTTTDGGLSLTEQAHKLGATFLQKGTPGFTVAFFALIEEVKSGAK
jgi:CheY-like chemotaxis protein